MLKSNILYRTFNNCRHWHDTMDIFKYVCDDIRPSEKISTIKYQSRIQDSIFEVYITIKL